MRSAHQFLRRRAATVARRSKRSLATTLKVALRKLANEDIRADFLDEAPVDACRPHEIHLPERFGEHGRQLHGIEMRIGIAEDEDAARIRGWRVVCVNRVCRRDRSPAATRIEGRYKLVDVCAP